MLSLFRKLLTGSSIKPSQFPFLDETGDNNVEVFTFDIPSKQWAEGISGSIYIEKLLKPRSPLMLLKLESHPHNLIRKITRDFELLPKDERTWVFRAGLRAEYSEYNETHLIACRFSSKATATNFQNMIKDVQDLEKAGFESLNFRLRVIRKLHEREVEEKESALLVKFPFWDDLLNGKYYQNFYSQGNFFRCSAEVREFDTELKRWKELILGTVKVEYLESTGQRVLTVIENSDFVRLELTVDVEIDAIDNRTRMWRGYKESDKGVESLLIGCRFINSKVAASFTDIVKQEKENAPARCAFRDEYICEYFKKEYQLLLLEHQLALETNFPDEYEIDDGLEPIDLPSTSKNNSHLRNNFPKIFTLSSHTISPQKFLTETSTIEVLSEYPARFLSFDPENKKWNEFGEGLLSIKRDAWIPKVWISMKLEIICDMSQDLELIEKDCRSFIWRIVEKKSRKTCLLMSRFKIAEVSEEFKNCVKSVQETYSTELSSDQVELEILKKLYETELQERCKALEMELPSHVDLLWLNGPDIKKYRTQKDVSETYFSKGNLFYSKVDIYKFDSTVKEWRKITGHPGLVSIKRKRFQEFQKTLIYAVTDEFEGKIVVKYEIASNLNLEMKNKTSWIWRGYVETENGDLESFLIACRFPNPEIAKNFKTVSNNVHQHSPWRCFLRDEFLIKVLKNEKERINSEIAVAVDAPIEEREHL